MEPWFLLRILPANPLTGHLALQVQLIINMKTSPCYTLISFLEHGFLLCSKKDFSYLSFLDTRNLFYRMNILTSLLITLLSFGQFPRVEHSLGTTASLSHTDKRTSKTNLSNITKTI